MKRIFSLLLIVMFCFCQAAKANRHVTKLELKVDKIQDQLKNLKFKIEAYESTQDPTLLIAIFREQKNLLTKTTVNYKKYKKVLNADLSNELKQTKILLMEAKENYIGSLKQSQQGSITEFDMSPSYWDVYNSLADDLDKFNRVVDEIEFAGLISSGSSGIYGQVRLISGNCMPTVSNLQNSSCGSATAISTKVSIYKPIKYQDINSDNSADLVSSALTNEQGLFYINLEPGLYSVFALDGTSEYCNSMDGNGYACLIEVKANEAAEFDINIDKAVY